MKLKDLLKLIEGQPPEADVFISLNFGPATEIRSVDVGTTIVKPKQFTEGFGAVPWVETTEHFIILGDK